MPGRISRKWRPPLLLVLGGAVGLVLMLPPAGLLAVRWLSPAMGFRASALMVSALVLLSALALALLLWRLLLRPIRALASRAEALRLDRGQGLDRPLDHYGTAELRDLGQAMLDMAGTLQNREATIRAFTDHVSHEFKTPLTAIRGAAELLGDAPPHDPESARLIAAISTSAARLDQLLTALREIAAAREPRYQGRCRVNDLLPALKAAADTLDIQADDDGVALPIAAGGLAIVLGHLVQNAAAAGATRVRITSRAGQSLTFADDGPGISPGNRADIFQPFFTTRRDAGGTGMGLAITRSLTEAHGGRISLLPADKGCAFELTWP